MAEAADGVSNIRIMTTGTAPKGPTTLWVQDEDRRRSSTLP